MAREPELRSCPFCGGDTSDDNACQEASVRTVQVKGPVGRYWRVECACGAMIGRQAASEAIAAWNRRADE